MRTMLGKMTWQGGWVVPMGRGWAEFLYTRHLPQLTLRRRLVIFFCLFALMAALCVGAITYWTISSILENRMQAAIRSNLTQVRLAMENSLSNLNHVSQLYSEQGSIGQEMIEFNTMETGYDRVRVLDQITTGINLICFTNPSIGMCAYLPVNTEQGYISNSWFKGPLPPQGLPLLAKYSSISYYGPHMSLDRSSNQVVLSAIRKLNIPGSPEMDVYIETSFNLTKQILQNDMLSEGIRHMMLDNEGKVVYSESADFPLGERLDVSGGDSGNSRGYLWYKSTSNQGWSMATVISDWDYNREKTRWLGQYSLFVLLFLALSAVGALVLWRTLYRPLRRFQEDIIEVERGDLDTPPKAIGIPEFDHIVASLASMKAQIKELFLEVSRKEKMRADLEIEKLRLQINPHFLMNSLNTAHWLAITHGQPQIDHVIQSLNKLLSYNLGKSGAAATLRDELAVLDEYMKLQRVRHDISYTVANPMGDTALDAVLPRFILQPIIENSIRHGIDDAPQIRVDISMEKTRLLIAISDNGPGMDQQMAERMLQGEGFSGQPRMGIGLSYVKRTLDSFYQGRADLMVLSGRGRGLSFLLYIPI